MRDKIGWAVVICVVFAVLGGAQDPQGGKKKGPEGPPVRPLPDDKRLLSLHQEFVQKAEKLAKEYETDKDWGKARSVYEEILKLVPQYTTARSKLTEMIQRESTAKSVTLDIKADEGWQDTKITLQQDKPVTIVAAGQWTFHLELPTDAEGLTIPKELRDFNPGCLIGILATGRPDGKERPFVVGGAKQFMADRAGRLFLRMYDTDPRDNKGSLKVTITGTFEHEK